MNCQRTTFSEIKQLLPADAWAAWRNERHAGEFETETVLVFNEATELDFLNLDAPFGEEEIIFLLLVQGDLTVKQFIYNKETDGATGLIVLGDLRVRNMLVGGQEIYVTGNLLVEEVFWGDYNHGDLHVLGNATATVFAETDQYSVNIEKQTAFEVHLTPYGSDGRWAGLDKHLTRESLLDDFISADEEGEITLVRNAAILSWLQAGQSLLKRVGA